jgi:hypothetical protein
MDHEELRDPAQHHLDAIDQFLEHLFQRCYDRIDDDFDKCVESLITSFDRYRKQGPAYEYPEDLLQDHGLTRNFMTAQLGALLLFANRVQTLTEKHDLQILRQPLQELWETLRRSYERFFGEPGPARPPGETPV